MYLTNRLRPALVLLLFGSLAPIHLARAQTSPGSVAGTVRDGSGAPVPGATIRIVDERTGRSIELVADARGSYTAQLPAGPYRIETTLDGFATPARRIVLESGGTVGVDITLTLAAVAEAVVVTARRVEEAAQEVPIPVSVIGGTLMQDTGAFNVNRLKEQIPTVQFYSTNPRNSSVQIRGLGAPFGLTNDGIEAVVGMYVDGVFHARPASATLDFLDVEQIEVLRGPQGTLFGKNTTAGAINVTTRKPTFTPETNWEFNSGSLGFVQVKGSVSGPLAPKAAGRASFSGTRRAGTIFEWSPTSRLRLLPGLRLNYDQKTVDFDQQVYGGLQTTNPALIALQRSILTPQKYSADVDDTNLSGQMTAAYKVARHVNAYGTYATGFKSVGLNLNGVPADERDQPVLSAATVKPEDVRHVEIGLKTEPAAGITANLSIYDTHIRDFQAQVVNAGVGVLRGYLANAEKVRVRGVELDGATRVGNRASFFGAAAFMRCSTCAPDSARPAAGACRCGRAIC